MGAVRGARNTGLYRYRARGITSEFIARDFSTDLPRIVSVGDWPRCYDFRTGDNVFESHII